MIPQQVARPSAGLYRLRNIGGALGGIGSARLFLCTADEMDFVTIRITNIGGVAAAPSLRLPLLAMRRRSEMFAPSMRVETSPKVRKTQRSANG
jgi:hypothetical protein